MDNKPQPDIQALALTKAIRATESGGNYQASGDAGTSTGAYQFQPDTWKQYSKEILGTDNAPMTEANQNAVAYGKVKKWKDSGLGPAEIAAAWNAGEGKVKDGSWTNNIGTTTINGTPIPYNTPAYVQKVVASFKQLYPQVQQQFGQTDNQATQTGEKPVGFVQGLVRAIASPFLRAGANIATLKDVANPEAYAKDQSQGINYGDYLGSYRPIGAQLDSKGNQVSFGGQLADTLGTGIEAASTIVPVEGLGAKALGVAGRFGAGTLEAAAKGKILGAVGKGIAEGGIIGAGQGLGSGLQEQGATAGSVIGSTVGGALAGGVGGGVFGAGGAVLSKGISALDKSGIVNKILPETEARIAKQQGFVKEAQDQVAKAYENTLPLTPTQRLREANLLNKTGDNVYTTLAKYNINAGKDTAIEELQKVSDQFENAVNHAQNNEHALFNIDEVRSRAYADINDNLSSETARVTAKNKIDSEIDALLKANKGSIETGANGETLVNSNLMERLRRTGNSWTPFNASDPEKIGKSAGWALANSVRDQVEKQGTFPAYRLANREWGKIIHAQEVLQKISDSGKSFKQIGGLSGSIGRKLLSGLFGFHTGGIAGTVLSEMGSEYAAKILSNPELRTYFDRKLIERFGTGKATNDAIMKLEQEVKNYVDEVSNRATYMALPPASPIGTPANPIRLPANESPMQILPAQKVISVNPKTGKVQKTFSSGTGPTVYQK